MATYMTYNPAAMITAIREKRPLVHHITNYVTVNDCANMTICAGGSPVMTDAIEDVPEMVALASAVVLNIGTLNSRTIESMIVAGRTANSKNIPVILDPVGAGATEYRTDTVSEILGKVKVDVIKGNGGEIGFLAGTGGIVKGVDSISSSDNQIDAVKRLSEITGAIVASTGKTDYVTDGKRTLVLDNGHELMDWVSGTGCMVSSTVGCYIGANGTSVDSVAAAISVMCIAGEIAGKEAKGPGSFKTKMLDAMYNMTPEMISSSLKAEEISE